ncbi:MAG: polysaccharide deacetylase family protein [Oscillospiraceae bacterium]|nr:polysaccharide deacetylase family protein [Oscillospiraceae bacterium]
MGKHCLCVLLCVLLLWGSVGRAEAKNGKYVALTFDDGPSGAFTRELLAGLKERGVKATFFLCGYRVDQYPKLAAQIAREGHEIGTHSDAHKFFGKMSQWEIDRDLAASVEKIRKATGKDPTLLRPPGGIYSRSVLGKTCCKELPIILWSVDPDDWCCNNSNTVVQRVLSQTKSGDVILLHELSESSVQAAFRIIDELQGQGYTFVTVSQLAKLSGKELVGGEVYSRFRIDN